MGDLFTERKRVGDWLKGELGDVADYCRETITVLAGEALNNGAVLGQITASGKYVAIDFSATDGSQTAAGILYTDAIEGDTSVDALAVAIVRGPVTVSDNGLVWPTGTSDMNKAAGIASLKSLE